MTLKAPILAAVLAIAAWTGTSGAALADNDDLKCTTAAEASWMSEDATKDLLLKQGYKEIRNIETTNGHCYEVYAVDAQGDKVEIYLDPTNGDVVAKED